MSKGKDYVVEGYDKTERRRELKFVASTTRDVEKELRDHGFYPLSIRRSPTKSAETKSPFQETSPEEGGEAGFMGRLRQLGKKFLHKEGEGADGSEPEQNEALSVEAEAEPVRLRIGDLRGYLRRALLDNFEASWARARALPADQRRSELDRYQDLLDEVSDRLQFHGPERLRTPDFFEILQRSGIPNINEVFLADALFEGVEAARYQLVELGFAEDNPVLLRLEHACGDLERDRTQRFLEMTKILLKRYAHLIALLEPLENLEAREAALDTALDEAGLRFLVDRLRQYRRRLEDS